MKIDFATFCYEKDAHRLHQPGQLKKQVDSNDYKFDNVIVVYQGVSHFDYQINDAGYHIKTISFNDFNHYQLELINHIDLRQSNKQFLVINFEDKLHRLQNSHLHLFYCYANICIQAQAHI